MLDLTSLLVTGRVSECLADFLGSGEQMSERVAFHLLLWKLDLTQRVQGIQKWESTVTDALVKLRDFSEKRVAPACQRVLVVLHEVLGWAQL
jgi:anaphase-promoting complex subunit 4